MWAVFVACVWTIQSPSFVQGLSTSYYFFIFRFFGSRFDNENNFGGRSIDEVSVNLAAVATAVAKVCTYDVIHLHVLQLIALQLFVQAVFRISKPNCSESYCDEVERSINASQERISSVLTCFLSNSSCELFQSVLIKPIADSLSEYRRLSLAKMLAELHTYYTYTLYWPNNAFLFCRTISDTKICDCQ